MDFHIFRKLWPFFLLGCLFLLDAASMPAAHADDLTIYCIDVGQGDATLVVGPDGTTMLIDGGTTGQASRTLIPLLNSLGITQLDIMVASHYHADHIGALDELANAGFFPGVAYDRGTYGGTPSTQAYSQYASAIASVRQTVIPGQVIPLGGGATATCIVVNGELQGGGTVNISGGDFENAASVGLLIEHEDFQYLTMGDLPGGGLSSPDVEGPVGQIVGDVDVHHVNHHGSSTSSQPLFLQAITPDIALISSGENNSYGHPTAETLGNLSNSAAAIPILQTTEGARNPGGVNMDTTFSIVADGSLYRVERDGTVVLRLLVDEKTAAPPAPDALVLTEYMNDPSAVSDDVGEYFEIFNTTTEDISLRGVEVKDGGSDSFLIASNVLVPAGEYFLYGSCGNGNVNGGFDAGAVWPGQAFLLDNTTDEIILKKDTVTIDGIYYDTGSGYPDPTGSSVERVDCLAATTGNNFAVSGTPFGSGDNGTPGGKNSVDTTDFPPLLVERGNLVPGGHLALTFHAYSEGQKTGFAGLALGTTPGFTFQGVHIPLNYDSFFLFSRSRPELFCSLDIYGKGSVTMAIPPNPGLSGLSFYTALIVLIPPANVLDASENALPLSIN
jgi:beta-lactamase superfamily II metal-dependent hydrolase